MQRIRIKKTDCNEKEKENSWHNESSVRRSNASIDIRENELKPKRKRDDSFEDPFAQDNLSSLSSSRMDRKKKKSLFDRVGDGVAKKVDRKKKGSLMDRVGKGIAEKVGGKKKGSLMDRIGKGIAEKVGGKKKKNAMSNATDLELMLFEQFKKQLYGGGGMNFLAGLGGM